MAENPQVVAGWDAFPLTPPQPGQTFWNTLDGVDFTEVFHITHLRDAIRIIEDGRGRSSVVWDESVITNTRTTVSWLSPNEFYQGSIYGNIRFVFNWPQLIANHLLYWVEARTDVNPTAVRLLIVTPLWAGDPPGPWAGPIQMAGVQGPVILERFPHEHLGGPVYCDQADGTWYRCNGLTTEFMLADDLPLADVVRIDFVGHHGSICKRKGGPCAELGATAVTVGARFMAICLGRNMAAATSRMNMNSPTTMAAAEDMLYRVAGEKPAVLPPVTPVGRETAKAILDAWGNQRVGQFEAMRQLFADPAMLFAATVAVIQEAFPALDPATLLN